MHPHWKQISSTLDFIMSQKKKETSKTTTCVAREPKKRPKKKTMKTYEQLTFIELIDMAT